MCNASEPARFVVTTRRHRYATRGRLVLLAASAGFVLAGGWHHAAADEKKIRFDIPAIRRRLIYTNTLEDQDLPTYTLRPEEP